MSPKLVLINIPLHTLAICQVVPFDISPPTALAATLALPSSKVVKKSQQKKNETENHLPGNPSL